MPSVDELEKQHGVVLAHRQVADLVHDQQGRVRQHAKPIAAAGTRIEPLALRPLTQRLLFIDGTRPVEVEWALAQVAPTRIVLLAGRPFDLARAHGRAFYFDQSGALTERFGLRATPTRIRQEGLKLRIAEIPLDENGREIPLRENTFGDSLSNEDLNP